MSRYYSWLINGDRAYKLVDKSVIKHKMSGIPMEIRAYFDIDITNLVNEEIKIKYKGNLYGANIRKIENSLDNTIRTALVWYTHLHQELKKELDDDDIDKSSLVFEKMDRNLYSLYIDSQKKEVEFVELNLDKLYFDDSFLEGDTIEAIRKIKKRNRTARDKKIESFKQLNGTVYCEVCGENDIVTLDVHHEDIQISQMNTAHITKLEDLRIVCANCHRKIHAYKLKVDELINV